MRFSARILLLFSLTLALGLAFAGCSDTPTPLAVDQDNASFAPSGLGVKPGTWETLTPVPAVGTGVEGACVAGIGNQIYVAQGHDNALGDVSTLRIYDIASDTWSFGADAPGANSEGQGAAFRGLLYVIGGRGPAGARNDIWSYDRNTDTWDDTLTPMNFARTAPAVAVHGGSIFVFGGRTNTGGPNSSSKVAVCERYDVMLDQWTVLAPLPTARSGAGAAAIGNKVYIFGGFDDNFQPLNDVDVYDINTDTWSTTPADMPTARGGLYAVTSKGNSVYVIGGWDGIGNGLDTNEAYKVSQDSWSTATPMLTPRAEHGVVGHGGRIYVVGGAQPGFGASVNSNEVYKP